MNADAGGFLAHPPDVWGTQVGEPGIHGVPRPRRWDVVVSAEARIPGDEVQFVALEDGSLIVDEAVEMDLSPLADAVEQQLSPPYRAEAVRRDGDVWAVAASKIEVAEVDDEIPGDRVELAVQGDERTVVVDGVRTDGVFPSLEALAAELRSYVIRAERLDDDLWEVRVAPL